MSRRPIGLTVGDRVEYIGSGRWADFDQKSGPKLVAGHIGTVVKVTPPYRGSGALLQSNEDGDDLYDEDEDGYATVSWPEWRNTLARVDHEGRTWRRL